jgi:hypothetical protein
MFSNIQAIPAVSSIPEEPMVSSLPGISVVSSIRAVAMGSNLLANRPTYGGRAFPHLQLLIAGQMVPIKSALLDKRVSKLSRSGETNSGDVIDLGA